MTRRRRRRRRARAGRRARQQPPRPTPSLRSKRRRIVLSLSFVSLGLVVVGALVAIRLRSTSSRATSEAEPEAATLDEMPEIPEIPDLDQLDPLFGRAVRGAVAAVRQSPTDGGAYGELGRLYHSHQYVDLARRCYALARRYDPGNADWPYYQGVLAVHAGRPEDAVGHFRAVLRLRPGDPAATLRLGQALLTADRADEAEAVFRALVAAEPDRPWGYIGLGSTARHRGELAEAVEQLEQARRIDPHSREATYKLALTYGELGRDEDSRLLMQTLQSETRASWPEDPLMDRVRHGRTDLQSLIQRANHLLDGGAPAPAKALYDTILSVDPEYFDAHYNLAILYRREHRLAEAEEELRHALRIRPESAIAHHAYAVVLIDQRRFPEAIAELEATLRLDPEHEEARAVLNTLANGEPRDQGARH